MGHESKTLLRWMLMTACLPACAAVKPAPAAAAPDANAPSVVDRLHGVEVPDPHRWLEDAAAPKVQTWVQEQDGRTRAILAALPSRAAYETRLRELFYFDSEGVPVRRGGRYFFRRTFAGKEKAVVYVADGEGSTPRPLLDPNGWSADGTVSLGGWVPSWDGRKVVYARKANNSDEATLHVIDVDSGEVSAIDVIPGGKYASPSWTPDSKSFYYEYLPTDPSIPVAQRPGYTEARLHLLGTDPAQDPVVHPRTNNPSTFLSVGLSRDGRYLFVNISRGWGENDLYWRDLGDPSFGAFRPLILGHDARYEVEAWAGRFYVTTDEGAPRGRVFRVDPAHPERAAWVEVVPQDAEAILQSASVVGGRLALTYLRNAYSEVRLASLDGASVQRLELPSIGSVSALAGDPDDGRFFLGFSSFTTPAQVWEGDVAGGPLRRRSAVQLPVDTSRFVTEQVWVTSRDGTRVPMFLVRRRDIRPDGTVPTVLYGYGGFDVSLTPDFRSSIIPWLERGGLYVVANLRGGGEFGKAWHDAGRGARKQNVFDDFEAAARWLVQSGWTSPRKLGIYGGSNGGLLVGTAMTQHPELYGAVACAVPLLDMVRYHLFGSGRTWIPEYGSAEDPEQFRTLLAYSPYHHVRPGVAYPPLLMLAAAADDRVDPLHARKFVAAVQATQGKAPALLRVEANAGHGGADQVRRSIAQQADMWSFFEETLRLAAER